MPVVVLLAAAAGAQLRVSRESVRKLLRNATVAFSPRGDDNKTAFARPLLCFAGHIYKLLQLGTKIFISQYFT